MLIEKKLIIDITKDSKEIQYLVQQYETDSRGVAIYFTKNKKDFIIPPEYTSYAQVEKPGGTQLYLELERQGNAVILPFTQEMTDKIGKLKCKILSVNKKGNVLLSSPVLYFGILGGLTNPKPYLTYDPDYNLFAEAVKTLNTLIDKSNLANIEVWSAIEKLNEINGTIDNIQGIGNALVALNEETSRLDEAKAEKKDIQAALTIIENYLDSLKETKADKQAVAEEFHNIEEVIHKISENLDELDEMKADKTTVDETVKTLAKELEQTEQTLTANLQEEVDKLGRLAYQNTVGADEITSVNPNVILQNKEYQMVSDIQIEEFQDKYTRGEIDNLVSELSQGLDWKESVDSFTDIETTYPNPEDGWTVNVKDDNITYRYNGTEWVAISANMIPLATDEVDGLLTSDDFIKLSSIESEANKTILCENLNAEETGRALDATMGRQLKIQLEKAKEDAAIVHGEMESSIENLAERKADKADVESDLEHLAEAIRVAKADLTEDMAAEIEKLGLLAYQETVAASQIISVNPEAVEQDGNHRFITDEQLESFADKYTIAEIDGSLSDIKAEAERFRENVDSLLALKAEKSDLAAYDTASQVDEKIADRTNSLVSAEVLENTINEKLQGKVDAAEGKGLSANDYTDFDKAVVEEYQNHITSDENPHNVTANQIDAYTAEETDSAIKVAINSIDRLKNATKIEDWDFVASEQFHDMVGGEIRAIYGAANINHSPWGNTSKGFIVRGTTATDYDILLFRAGHTTDIVTRSCYQDTWSEWEYIPKASEIAALEARVAALENK